MDRLRVTKKTRNQDCAQSRKLQASKIARNQLARAAFLAAAMKDMNGMNDVSYVQRYDNMTI